MKETPPHSKFDERNRVEKPLLDQLASLGWEMQDLGNRQLPTDTFRNSFTETDNHILSFS